MKEARFNQQLVGPDGNEIPGFRPDAQRLRKDGKVDVVEVQSPTQEDQFMEQKITDMKKALGENAGNITWEPTPK